MFDNENFPDITAVSDDVQKRDKMRAISPTLFKDLAGITERDGSIEMYDYSYIKERGKLNRIVKDIFKNNTSDFKSVEEIFDIFAKAAMSGKLLPVARLIEKTYGKGSFRKLGEETQTKATQII